MAPPDLEGIPGRLSPAYLQYPANPKALSEPNPGSGGPISAVYPFFGAAPPAVDGNVFWQALNKELNADLQAMPVPSGEWSAKFAVLVAGDDMPDILVTDEGFPQLPDLLEAKSTDLSDYLSGDAVLDYPNLANLPTAAWEKGCMFNGKIFAIPLCKEPTTAPCLVRKDILDDLGIPASWSSFAEFGEVATEVTDERVNRWAMCDIHSVVKQVLAMLGLPNEWAVKDGEFVKRIETEEHQQALASVAELWKSGLFHPDSTAYSLSDGKQWFTAGRSVFHWDGILAWVSDVFLTAGLSHQIAAVVTPGFDGGPGSASVAPPYFKVVGLPKAEPEGIKEILRVMDYLYAPFGSKEYVLKNYGVEGVDYTLEGTDPVPTQQGLVETSLAVRYMSLPPAVTYAPGEPEVAESMYEYGAAVQDIIIDDPVLGLRSETGIKRAGDLNPPISDAIVQVVTGKADMSAFTDAVDEWRKRGGDEIRGEYEEAAAAQ